MTSAIKVSEIFGPTIQGEGALIGEPTVFVRTGGCDYRCSWCDSLHAVDSAYRFDWTPMSAADIWAQVHKLSGGVPILVSLSGGNPAIQPLSPLIALGKQHHYRFALETQGTVSPSWLKQLDVLVLSPKPPSSDMETDWGMFNECIQAAGQTPTKYLKIVVFDEADYLYAQDVSKRYPEIPIFLQPGNHTPPPLEGGAPEVDIDGLNDRMRWLIGRALRDHWYEATILPQLHVALWGNKRGV